MTHFALYADLQLTALTHFPANNYIYCQKVGQLKYIQAVPPLKVGRLEPSHGDRFRRQCVVESRWHLATHVHLTIDVFCID